MAEGSKAPQVKPEVVETLRRLQDVILNDWERQVRREFPAAQSMSRLALRDSFPGIIERLAEAIVDARKSSGLRSVSSTHAHERALLTSYSIEQVLNEYAALRETILATLERETDITSAERRAIRRTLDLGAAEAAHEFMRIKSATDNVADAETRHAARRLQAIQMITEVALAHSDDLEELLQEVLAIIMKTLEVDTASILLLVDSGKNLAIHAAKGIEAVTPPTVRIPATRGVAGRVLQGLQSVIIDDLSNVEVASPALKPGGVRSLMVAPLKIERRPIGVVQIGSVRARRFTEDERTQLQIVADRIAIAIDHARLYQEVQRDNELLTEERELRDRFIAALTHDLRSPLSSVKMGIDMIRRYPDRIEVRERQFVRIDGNLARIDRMIEDLLDANRIQAGHLVDLRIEHFDLPVLVREIADEFATTHNRAITVGGLEHFSGYWDLNGVRRIFENLITNALKYGSKTAPVTLNIASDQEFLKVSVHNEGNPIPASDLKHLFDRYVRSNPAQGEQKGWGIGLTLVRGFVQAHGGTVSVESSVEKGTTFTVSLPMDARQRVPVSPS